MQKLKAFLVFSIFTFFLLIFSTPVYAATIKINEFSSAAGTSSDPDWPDWVEVYYVDFDPALYQLRDAVDNIKNLSDGTCAGNFCTVDWSNKLNNPGDTIKLVLISDPTSVADQVTYGTSGDVAAPVTGQYAGRSVDGTGGWTLFLSSTKGSTNNTATPAPTATPTSIPIPTPTPSPTNIPTPTKTPTPTPTKVVTSTPTSIKSLITTPKIEESPAAGEAGLVLAENIASESPTPTPQIITAGFAETNLAKILIILGGLFLASCGIVFAKWKKEII